MSTTRKLVIGLGVAGGAILAAWLLTGNRKQKTKEFVVKRTQSLKDVVKKEAKVFDDSDAHYV
ncbi:MAG: hypothetical protein DI538_20075 [Azospira oryzae]|jgi:hypothetical protein|nr:MAG: hypothetical protein DI538_20075 [Azospira oryzae]